MIGFFCFLSNPKIFNIPITGKYKIKNSEKEKMSSINNKSNPLWLILELFCIIKVIIKPKIQMTT